MSATATSAASDATYDISISTLAKAHSVRSNSYASKTDDLTSSGVLTDGDTFTIGGKTFTVGANEYGKTVAGKETLSSLVDKINYASSSMTDDKRVTASIISASPTSHYLVLTREKTGDTYIDSMDTSGSSLQSLGIRSSSWPGDNYSNVLVNHSDASFMVNNIAVTRSNNTGISDVINGVTFDLLDTSITDFTLTVSADKSAVKSAITDFIDKYNILAATLAEQGKIETQGSALDPDGASIASKGVLADDPLVAEIVRNMRSMATGSKSPSLNNVNASYTFEGKAGVMDSLQDIGVWTTGRDNQLEVIDEARLEAVISNNFGKVEQLFRGIFDSTKGYQNGVASDFFRYSDGLSQSITGGIATRVKALEDKSTLLGERVKDLDDYLVTYEQELWNRFTYMDKVISKLQTSIAGLSAISKTS
jgi:flagellar hook-associated protein 2